MGNGASTFEAYLRAHGGAVVDARLSYLDDAVKSPDFLVIAPDDSRLVMDVQGPKFPGWI